MIGFIGLSHLGIVSSIASAAKSGERVVAYDADTALCSDLQNGRLPILEPGLPELLKENKTRVEFGSDRAKLSQCPIVYFAIDIPTDDQNRSDVRALDELIDKVLPTLKEGAVVVILSQVPPGFTRTLARKIESAYPAKRLRIFYQAETLIFGNAVERAMSPERLIVGCPDPRQGLPEPLEKFLKNFQCPLFRVLYESAELAKISINLCLASTLSSANTIAEICEAIGADWSEIIPVLRTDKRIGPHAYLAPGLGIAGGNLERDLVTVRELAREWGSDAAAAEAFLANSRHRKNWTLKIFHSAVLPQNPKPVIAVWGLAYKPQTRSIKNSPSFEFLKALDCFKTQVYDPQVVLEGKSFPHAVQAASAIDACRNADALFILTAWKEFQAVDPDRLREAMTGKIIADPFGVLNRTRCLDLGFDYFTLGAKPARGEGPRR